MSEQTQDPQEAPPTGPLSPVADPEPDESEPQAPPPDQPAAPQEAPQEPAQAPSSPDEGEGSPDEEPDEDGAQEAVQPVPEAPATPQGLSEQEIEKRQDKLARENERHAKRVGEIMEEDGNDLIPCPICMDGIAGWIYPPDAAPLSEEAVHRTRQVIGLPDYSNMRQVAWAQQCEDCGGNGEVLTGSHKYGEETTTCLNCKGHGWLNKRGSYLGNGHDEAAEPIMTGVTVLGEDHPDPEIQHLLERGFTVIPPFQVEAR